MKTFSIDSIKCNMQMNLLNSASINLLITTYVFIKKVWICFQTRSYLLFYLLELLQFYFCVCIAKQHGIIYKLFN